MLVMMMMMMTTTTTTTTTGMFVFGAEVLFPRWADKPFPFHGDMPHPWFLFVSFVTWLFICRSSPFGNKTGPLGKHSGLCTINWDRRLNMEQDLETCGIFTAYSYSLTVSVHSLFGTYFFVGTNNDDKMVGFWNQMTFSWILFRAKTHLTCKGSLRAFYFNLLDAYTVETLMANGPLNNIAKKGLFHLHCVSDAWTGISFIVARRCVVDEDRPEWSFHQIMDQIDPNWSTQIYQARGSF